MRPILACALIALFAVSCDGNTNATDSSSGSRSFAAALNAGATCAELFEIRNEPDPKDAVVETMNAELRRIGCFSSSSTRTDR